MELWKSDIKESTRTLMNFINLLRSIATVYDWQYNSRFHAFDMNVYIETIKEELSHYVKSDVPYKYELGLREDGIEHDNFGLWGNHIKQFITIVYDGEYYSLEMKKNK